MKKKIALLAGGFTGEYVISLQTADTIAANIDREKYEVYKVVISREGWFHEDGAGTRWPVDKNDFSIRLETSKVVFDVALIAIHGSPGEDGRLQGYLELLDIPYTTCDVTTSAITMNKSYTKNILAGTEGLHLAGSVQLFREWAAGMLESCRHLQLPLFVKPNNGGSSIGMSKVGSWEELEPALERAFREDGQVLVEEYIKGREYSVGAFRVGGELEVLPSTEIIPGRDFFDFEAKYSPGASEEITPGRLPENARLTLEQLVKEVYQRLNCRGAVRMDFIQEEETGHWYFIEVNTVPGQSENSILPRQIRASGRSMGEFYSLLIEEASRRND
ncbi:D-alanine-D-alanine ligase [Anseongella ginsenosidimutans]|uniref:D-alanine--D-alanine ligase n=1 Tax=Anseongella ginsenosidimutans TaxID=496056 RepID=A0A4R3KUQ8_9SPHI|nr:D-alanine--D-alanine ligase [Anseongella ginsenosidimutans]QEC53503.1 D-alanine--D-alanine ligase [Anseongella ginsenosidimutans]TCS88405.1 D-alanine-D-alanine ligase [Anseongella ginsenosidimutans]